MIEAIRLLNFQRHEKRVVELDPHVTTIVGPTDSGKSSIIRALVWALMNEAPDNLLRQGAKEVEVDVKVDGHMVKRIRKGTENRYSLDGKQYRAFGIAVPEDIEALLRIGSINIQAQHDSVFWFSAKAADVSKQLNSIVDLEIIDESLARAASHVRETKSRLDVSTDRLENAKRKVEELKYAVELDEDCQRIERLEDELKAMQKRTEALGVVIWELDAHHATLDEGDDLLKDLVALLKTSDQFQATREKADEFDHALSEWGYELEQIEGLAYEFKQAEFKFTRAVHGKTCPLCLGKGKL